MKVWRKNGLPTRMCVRRQGEGPTFSHCQATVGAKSLHPFLGLRLSLNMMISLSQSLSISYSLSLYVSVLSFSLYLSVTLFHLMRQKSRQSKGLNLNLSSVVSPGANYSDFPACFFFFNLLNRGKSIHLIPWLQLNDALQVKILKTILSTD